MLSGILNESTKSTANPLDAYFQISNERFEWLADISIQELISLRAEGANEEFRSRIRDALQTLYDSALEDASAVAREIAFSIKRAIRDHQKEISQINCTYAKKYAGTLFSAAMSVPALFVPALAPVVGTLAPVAAAGKIVWDIIGHFGSLRRASKSLMGILARNYPKD